MVRHYLLSAWRFLSRFKSHTLLNSIGLSLGIAACGLILLFVKDELRYDRHFPEAESLHRVTTIHTSDGAAVHSAAACAPVADALRTGISTASVTRVYPQSLLFGQGDVRFQEDRTLLVDPDFLDVFGLRLIDGDPRDFHQPHAVLLTESLAKKYFPSQTAVGKSIRIENRIDLFVAGVVADAPGASHLTYTALVNMQTVRTLMGDWVLDGSRKAWHWPPMHVYIKSPMPREDLQNDVRRVIHAARPRYIDFDPVVQPVVDIHLHSNLRHELQPNGSFAYVVVLSAAAALLLLLAVINFGNLSAALYARRTKEVSIRKVVGAGRRQLMMQFILESVVMVTLTVPFSWMLAEWALPSMNAVTGKALALNALTDGPVFLAVALFATWAGMIYPSMMLSGLRSFSGLTESAYRSVGRSRTRKCLMISQFAVSLAFVFGAWVIDRQMRLVADQRLGFDKEGLIVIPVRDEDVQERFDTVKRRLQAESGVVSISALSNLPWKNGFYGFPIKGEGLPDEGKMAGLLMGDEDMPDALQLDVVAGRSLTASDRQKSEATFLVNTAAMAYFGWDAAVGKRITVASVASGKPVSGTVVGVVADFYLRSLHVGAEPVVLMTAPESYYLDNFVVRLRPENVHGSLEQLQAAWREVIPERPMEFTFVDDALSQLYRKDRQLLDVVRTFSILLIVLACFGLIGMTGVELQRRTREIGIRKVMGAGPAELVRLMLSDVTRIVVLAAAFGFPLAWMLTQRWLDNFSIKAELPAGAPIGLIAGALVLAWMTVSLHVWRAISIDPVKTLSSE